jgi:ribosomal protein S18 acetylase RimI-like enzyme
MHQRITPADIRRNPALITTSIILPPDQEIIFRPLERGDAQVLGDYFDILSDQTREYFGPHPLDRETADRLCETINHVDTIRMIGTVSSDGRQKVIAYLILLLGVTDSDQARYERIEMALDPQADCTVAPSLADAFQNHGLGSILMRRLSEIARALGHRRMVLLGGTQAANSRAVHFYHKLGFRTVGAFEHPAGRNNYDMVLQL